VYRLYREEELQVGQHGAILPEGAVRERPGF
jgi:hypothetical protein